MFKKTREIVCLFELLILPIGPNALNMEVLYLTKYNKNILNILFEKISLKNKLILCLMTFGYSTCVSAFPLLSSSSLLCLYIFPMSMSLSAPLSNLSLALPPSLSSCFSTLVRVFPFLFLPLATAGPMVSLVPPNWITLYASPGLYRKLSHLVIPHRKDKLVLPLPFSLFWQFCFIPPFRVLNIKSRGMPLSPIPLT